MALRPGSQLSRRRLGEVLGNDVRDGSRSTPTTPDKVLPSCNAPRESEWEA